MRAAAFVPPITPDPDDIVVRKRRYSAFHGTGLAARLRALGRDQVIVAGVFAHIGCLATANDAFAYDLEAFLVGDAVADFSARHHRLALDYAASRCAVVLSTDRVIGHLTDGRRPSRGAPRSLPVVPVS
jgi:bifunctional isochorismate lyase/aryl carrier protein